MNRQQIIGGFTALKGAGLIGTFTYLDGIRLLDGQVFTAIIWCMIILGLLLLLTGLGYAAAADES